MTTTASWKNTLLGQDASLREAIENLDHSGLQIVLVVDAQGLLQGTVTDGDIRRGLLRGLTLENSINEIIHRDAFVVPPDMDRKTVLALMQANEIRQLPIVDEQRRVLGLHLWNKLAAPAPRHNTMVIMAGGQGSRLRPHTENCPKPLLPVAGKPMLEHIILRAKEDGFRRFVLALHYLGHMVVDHFGNGEALDVEISYIREPAPMGTAGALGLLDPLPGEALVVTNGDVLTDISYGDLLDFHRHHGAAATMAVRSHEWQNPFGVVNTQGVEIVSIDEKPVYRSHINAGIYVLEPDLLMSLKGKGRMDMPELFIEQRQQGQRVLAYPMHEPWLDVGREQDLLRARDERGEGKS
ncbi:nucleotidyltransferase family protein [Thiolapillus brandeum]|uniref:CBS domain-containing protein n=1 Tax=Thiolapillus brandeum TaxID=1076588 RepID=A0A7U6GHF1_9GAMM|nr:nucleotidyltransferase family protein [Thiolapillus brandeum]BAO43680.1 conserved hypothetical protein [Thiolapillus brandeum]